MLAALLFKHNTGYALFVAPPYRVELSLNAFVVLVLVAFVALYLLMRFSATIARLPREVREARRRRNLERARAKQDSAVVALLEGRYGKARQYADEALAVPLSSGIAALVAARAALDTREFDAAESYLGRPDAGGGSLTVPRLMLEAETALERGQPGDALARLAELKREAGLHTAALRLELRALTAAGRHVEIAPLVDQLVKRRVYDAAQGDLVRAGAHAEALASLRQDAAGLRTYWNRLPDTDQENPRVARAGAESFLILGGDREAAEIIVRCLSRTWDPELTVLYAQCRTPEPTRQLETAEQWLRQHRAAMRRCSTHWASCAIGNRCGARRRHTSRRASHSTTTGAYMSRSASFTEDPYKLARLLVGSVVHAAEHVDVDGEKEHRCAVGVKVAQQPAVVDIPHDAFDAVERQIGMRRVVHRKDDAGRDLGSEHEGKDCPERPPVAQVARRRVGDELGINEPPDRQPLLDPLQDWMVWMVGAGRARYCSSMRHGTLLARSHLKRVRRGRDRARRSRPR